MFGSTNTARTLSKRAKALRERMNANQRCKLAQEIGVAYEKEGMSDTERTLAEEIIVRLVEDEIVKVRSAISEAVAGSPHLPGRIARKLAQDIAEVSVPVLELSPNLEERFLEDIVKSGITEKISAVANRKEVSANLSRHIVASGRKGAVVRLLKNRGAEITDHTMVTIVRVYCDDARVEKAVFDRDTLSDDVIETLRELTEAHVTAFIQRYFNLPEHMVDVDRGRKLMEREEDDRRSSNWWDNKQGAV